jgi:hypothetical protein
MKKKHNEPYIRKNGATYTTASVYCCVNKNNQVTDIGVINEETNQNGYLTYNLEAINQSYTKFISKSSLKNSKPEDKFIVFITNDLIHLNKPLFLERKVRGCRFADDIEIKEIMRSIVKQYISEYNITHQDMFYNIGDYPELYRLCSIYDFLPTLFDLESEGGLYKNYWEVHMENNNINIDKTIQTKLI